MQRNLILALACAGAQANAHPELHERQEASAAVISAAFSSFVSSATQEPIGASSIAITASATETGISAPVQPDTDDSQTDNTDQGNPLEGGMLPGIDPSSLEQLQTYAEVCFPNATSGGPDFNAPCNTYAAIEAQCMLGPQGLELLSRPSLELMTTLSQSDIGDQLLDPEVQRACVCQSQYLDATTGCNACGAHIGLHSQEYAERYDEFVKNVMEEYCRVDNTPTAPFLVSVAQAFINEGGLGEWLDTQGSSESDVGSATDVSDYYTLSVPGSSVYSIPFATPSGNVTFTSTKVSGGLIVPTATAAASNETGDGHSEGPTEFEGGAAMVGSQAIGMVGFVGFLVVAALL